MPNEKKYKATAKGINKFYVGNNQFTANEIIETLIREGFLKEITFETQYWLGSVRLYQNVYNSWYDVEDDKTTLSSIRMQDDIFQQLLSEGKIEAREVEVADERD